MDDHGNLWEDLPANMLKRAQRQQVAKMAGSEYGQQVANMAAASE